MKLRFAIALAGALSAAGAAVAIAGGGAARARPSELRFEPDGRMAYPAAYRSWTFVTTGHGMSYRPEAQNQANPPFDNVFVNPSAWRAFNETGHWPDGTALVLEIRAGTSKGSILTAGSFQTGPVLAVEAHVRDRARFGGDGWAFFEFDAGNPAAKLDRSADCYACHEAHGAVDTTFVQFYPSLLPVAHAKGTISLPGEIQ